MNDSCRDGISAARLQTAIPEEQAKIGFPIALFVANGFEWGRRAIPWHDDHHMNTAQDANWCVTRPWWDYIMGTRVFADPAHAESNPPGIKLPTFVEKSVNAVACRLLPHAFAHANRERERERQDRTRGVEPSLPEFADQAA